jgi:hypothetical protein
MSILAPQVIESTSTAVWTISGNLTAAGNAVVGAGVGTNQEAVLYLKQFIAAIPADHRITGISVKFTATGTFTTNDFLKINVGFYTAAGVPLADGVEKTVALNGLSGTPTTAGSSSDNWGKPFWTRQEINFNSNQAFAVSFSRVGSAQITLTNVEIEVYTTAGATLIGSRAPAPGGFVAQSLATIIPTQTDGTGEVNVIKSADINLLGDALYNLEKFSTISDDLPNAVKVFGSSVVFMGVNVTGQVSDFSKELSFEEIKDGTTTTIHSGGLKNVARTEIALPSNKSCDFSLVKGVSWLEKSGVRVPLHTSVHSFVVEGEKLRLALRFSALANQTNPAQLVRAPYSGLYYPDVTPSSTLMGQTLLDVDTLGIPGSSTIPGFTLTYPDGPTISNPPNPQAVVYDPIQDAGNTTFGQPILIPAISLQSYDSAVPGLTNGVKSTNTLGDYNYVDFEIPQLESTYDQVSLGLYSMLRGGIFVCGQNDPTTNLSAYAVMFSKGPNDVSNTALMWLVKLVGYNTTVAQTYTGFNPGNANAYQTFPVTSASIVNIGVTYHTVVGNLADPSSPKKYRLFTEVVGANTLARVEQYSPGSNTYTTVLSALDVSSPITTGGDGGFFEVKSTLPVNINQVKQSKVKFSSLVFGNSNPPTETVELRCKIFALGSIKDV